MTHAFQEKMQHAAPSRFTLIQRIKNTHVIVAIMGAQNVFFTSVASLLSFTYFFIFEFPIKVINRILESDLTEYVLVFLTAH